MTSTETAPSPAQSTGTNTDTRQARLISDLPVLAGSVLAAVAVWALWTQALGVDLAADTGGTVRQIAVADVVVAAVLASTLGLLLCRLLVGKAASPATGLRRWTITAVVVCLLSLLGTTGAVSVAAGAGLASLHLVVGATVVLGARRTRRAR